MKQWVAIIDASLVLAAQPTSAQPQIEQRTVQFNKGESGATIKGTLKGDRTIDYKLTAGAGQSMVIQFAPRNASAHFNLLPPGSAGEANHIGLSASNDLAGELKTGGTYTARVYLMRNAARRNESTHYTLDVGISGDVKTN